MKQIDTRWYQWSRYDPARRQDEHGYFLAGEDVAPGVLVDPVPFAEGDEAHLGELGGVGAVVVTGPSRLAAARACAAAFRAPLHVPEHAADGADAGAADVQRYGDDARLPGDLLSVTVHRAHAALVHEETRSALTGELIVGGSGCALKLRTLEHAVGVAEAQWPDVAHALRGVLARFVRRVLVTAGTPILQEGDRALQDLVYRHDPAAFLLRASELRWDPPLAEAPHAIGSRFGVRFAECAHLLGLKTLEFDLAEVPPGKESVQFHRHDGEEECFVVLSGTGEVLTSVAPLAGEQPHLPAQTLAIAAGDMLGFPPRYQVAHAIRNTGDVPLRYLCFGAPSETLDMVDYVETGIRMERTPYGKRARFTLPTERAILYWDRVRTD
jgi:uncharacterized cupin superfamily protein